MENPTQPTSEATTATHNNQPKGDATPTHYGPVWVGLHVEPEATRVLDAEIIWIGTAGPGFDFDRAERICQGRKVYQVVFNFEKTTIEVDFADAESFADFVNGCRDELAFDRPVFDSPAEERLTEDAIRFLYAESERQARTKGDAR